MMNFDNKEKNTNRINALAQALTNAKGNNNNSALITAFQPIRIEGESNANNSLNLGNAGQLLGNAARLYSDWRSGTDNEVPFGGSSAISDSINSDIFGGGSSGSTITDAVNGYNSPDTISGAIDSNVMSSGGGFNGMPLIGTALGGLKGYSRTGDWQGGVQGMFGVDSENDSDVMQGIKGTANGAMTGLSVGGPWGALIGGILGLGSSFIDDI